MIEDSHNNITAVTQNDVTSRVNVDDFSLKRRLLEAVRPILRLLCLLYYIISISFRICFFNPRYNPYSLTQGAPAPEVFVDYLVDLFFFIDALLLLTALSREGRCKVQAASHGKEIEAVTHGSDERQNRSSNALHNRSSAAQWVRLKMNSITPTESSSIKNRNTAEKWNRWTTLRLLRATIWHLLLLIPFEAIVFATDTPRAHWLRATKLLRCFHCVAYWKDVSEAVLAGLFHVYFPGQQRIILLTILMAVIAHLAACFYYSLSLHTMLQYGTQRTWIVQQQLASFCSSGGVAAAGGDAELLYDCNNNNNEVHFLVSLSDRYFRSLYWSVATVTSVAFGDITAVSEAETAFCIIYFYLAALLVYLSIANLTMVITSLDSARTENLIKIAKFERYAAYRKLPAEIINRVVSYYEYQWERLRGINEQQILNEIPSNLSQQILQYTTRDLLMKVELLQDMHKGCLNVLSDRAEHLIFSPTDIVIEMNSLVTGLYIISSGFIEVRKRSSIGLVAEEYHGNHTRRRTSIRIEPSVGIITKNRNELSVGQHFGIPALQRNYSSSFRYRALTFCEIFVLRGSVFRHVCQMTLPQTDLTSLHDRMENVIQPEINVSVAHLGGPMTDTAVCAQHEDAGSESRTAAPVASVNDENLEVKAVDSVVADANVSPLAPGSLHRMWWDLFLFLGLTFYLFSTALLISGMVRMNFLAHYRAVLVACYIMDVIFFIDMILNATCFGFLHNGAIVLNSAAIWSNFFRQPIRLAVDIIAIFPFDILVSAVVSIRLAPICRINKLMHLRRFYRLEDNASDWVLAVTGIAISFEVERFFVLYYTLVMICHWVACLWQLIADASVQHLDYNTNWRREDIDSELYSVNYDALSGTSYYFRSMYWAVNVLSSIGVDDILPTNAVEMGCLIVIMFFGYLLFNTVIGAIASLMSNFNRDARENDLRVERIQQLIHFKSIHRSIEKKILRYYEYKWSRYGGVDEDEVLMNLPPSLRSAVAHHVVGPMLRKVPFFKCISEPMELMIVSLIQSRVFVDGDALVLTGEIGKEMFLIEHGVVEITNIDRSESFARLSCGDYLGESCLLEYSSRIASAYAVGYVNTFCLTSEAFLQAAERFPAEYGSILLLVQEAVKIKAKNNLDPENKGSLEVDPVQDIQSKSSDDKWAFHQQDIEIINYGLELADEDVQRIRLATGSSDLEQALEEGNNSMNVGKESNANIVEGNSSSVAKLRSHSVSIPEESEECAVEDYTAVESRDDRQTEVKNDLPSTHVKLDVQSVDEPVDDTREAEDGIALSDDADSVGSDIAAVASVGNIHPDSTLKLCWDAAMCLIIIYYAVMIPMRIVLRLSPYLLLLDYFLDAVMLLDSYLCIAVFAIYVAGELLVYDPDIRANYFRKRLLIDALSEFPYDFIGLAFLNAPRDRFLLVLALLRLPKLIKLMVLSQYYKYLRIMLNKLNFNFVVIRMLELIVSLLLVSNWVGCSFYAFAVYGQHPGDCHDEANANYGNACEFRDTWVEQQIATQKLPADGGSQWSQFLRAFYWAVTTSVAVTVGDVQVVNSKEVIFAFFVMIGVLSVNGMIIGSVMSIVMGVSEESSDLSRSIDLLRSYLTDNGINSTEVEHAVAILRYFASKEGMLTRSQEQIFAELPHSIRLSIDAQIKTIPYLRHCPIFDICTDELLRGIASHLLLQFYVLNDHVVVAGELGYQMYFLEAGTVQVISADGMTVLTNLEQGAFFGETSFFFNTKRTASVVVSSAFSACLALNKIDLERELRTTDFDPEQVLSAFSILQSSNVRRNEAVQRNLIIAENPSSKLHKLIQVSEESTNKNITQRIVDWIRMTVHPTSSYRIVWDTISLMCILFYALWIPFGIAFLRGNNLSQHGAQLISVDAMVDIFFIIDIVSKAAFFSVWHDNVRNQVSIDGYIIWKRYVGTTASLNFNSFQLIASLMSFKMKSENVVDSNLHQQAHNIVFHGVGSGGDGWFYWDVIASFPLELILLSPTVSLRSYYQLRAHHLIRVMQLLKQLDLVEHHFIRITALSIPRAVSLLMRAVCAFAILNHWLACSLFMIHRYAERNERLTYVTADGLASFNDDSNEHDVCSKKLIYCYARSLYFVVGTMSGVGYGDIAPYTNIEFGFQIIIAIISALLAATLLGFCQMFLEDRDYMGQQSIQMKLDQVAAVLNVRMLPDNLQKAILAQYNYMWRKTKSFCGGSGNELLYNLSNPTAMGIARQLHGHIIHIVPLLNQLPSYMQRRIALILSPQLAMRESYLYHAGDVGNAIFFIAHGSVRTLLTSERSMLDSCGLTAIRILLNKHAIVGDIFTRGDHFGEYCILSQSGLRTDSAQALTTTELYTLDKKDLWNIFQYCLHRDRWQFLENLMIMVGNKYHIPMQQQKGNEAVTSSIDDSPVICRRRGSSFESIPSIDNHSMNKLNDENESNNNSIDRLKSLFRLAFEVMLHIIERMNELKLQLPEGAIKNKQHSNVSNELLLLLHEQNSSGTLSHFTRKDIIELFLRKKIPSSGRFDFSAAGLMSRIQSMTSAKVSSATGQQQHTFFMDPKSIRARDHWDVVRDRLSHAVQADDVIKAEDENEGKLNVSDVNDVNVSESSIVKKLSWSDDSNQNVYEDGTVNVMDATDIERTSDQSVSVLRLTLTVARETGVAAKSDSNDRRLSRMELPTPTDDYGTVLNAIDIEDRLQHGRHTLVIE